MQGKEIYEILDKERRLKFDSQVDAARKIGITKESFYVFMQNLKNDKGVTLKTLNKLLDGFDYEMIIRKKK